jgi:hypothetical protein
MRPRRQRRHDLHPPERGAIFSDANAKSGKRVLELSARALLNQRDFISVQRRKRCRLALRNRAGIRLEPDARRRRRFLPAISVAITIDIDKARRL